MTIQMKALRRFYVKEQRKEYQAGDTFEVATDKDADTLARVKRAERVKPAERATETSSYQAYPESGELPQSLRRPAYKRRDMKAEE